jgi:hypothetical protein
MSYYKNLFSLLNRLIYNDYKPLLKIALGDILKKSVTNYINLLILIITFLPPYRRCEPFFITALNYTLIKSKSVTNYISLSKVDI